MLLSRDKFRESVFERDNHKCVFCKNPAVDAHHIIERRLFSDGGYYIDNGASVCEEHHLACERTDLSVEEVREACGITKKILPEHFYHDEIYDKWGNIVLPSGARTKGELFFDESVQKIIKNHLCLFTDYVKYPRTYHLPWSENMNDDDRMIGDSQKLFENKQIVVTEKLDGENTTMYSDYIHARSVDGRNHESRNWVKNFWSQIAHDIPKGWRICGENMFAVHSIKYNELESYFYGFSIWNEKNECLSWDDTVEWFNLLNIKPVPVLYKGIYDEQLVKSLYNKNSWETSEGYVLRNANKFSYSQFRYSVGKFVRKDHIQTVKHWMHGQAIERNLLK